MDFGTIMCMASNMVGMQRKPCVFHIIMAGKFLIMSIPPHIEYDFNPILPGGSKGHPSLCFGSPVKNNRARCLKLADFSFKTQRHIVLKS